MLVHLAFFEIDGIMLLNTEDVLVVVLIFLGVSLIIVMVLFRVVILVYTTFDPKNQAYVVRESSLVRSSAHGVILTSLVNIIGACL